MQKCFIRPATADDSKEILDIYTYYILNTTASFDITPPPLAEFTRTVESISKRFPYIVYVSDSEIAGYAYASRHREREAYRYDVDLSIYLKNTHHGKGVGSALYGRLFELLAETEFYNAYAGITLPNEKSVALHKKFGFSPIGVHHNTGYKFNKWLDVLWLEKALKDPSVPPQQLNAAK